MRFLTKLAVFGVVAGMAAGGAVFANASGASADDPQPPIEETYEYPGAEAIFAEKGIKLIKGDGHILFTDCVTGADLIRVSSRSKPDFCFKAKGTKGWLTLEAPLVYLIKADAHNLAAKVTVDGETESVAVPKNEYVGVGEGGANPDAGPATLVEIRLAS